MTPTAPVSLVPAAAPSQPCPICGTDLVPVVLDPETAPWLCPNLTAHRNGFWQAELDARADYHPATRCFAHHVVVAVQAAVVIELRAATVRGTSVRPDQLRHLPQDQLVALASRRGVDSAFCDQARSLIVKVS